MCIDLKKGLGKKKVWVKVSFIVMECVPTVFSHHIPDVRISSKNKYCQKQRALQNIVLILWCFITAQSRTFFHIVNHILRMLTDGQTE